MGVLMHLLIGKRIRLISTDDPYTELRPGDEGTIDYVDDIDTVFVKWDCGSRLGLVRNHDRYEIID